MAKQKEVCIVAAVYAATVCVLTDGRMRPSERERVFSVRNPVWKLVQSDCKYDDSWFHHHFRCSRSAFDAIVVYVEARWSMYHKTPHHNAVFLVRDRVAVTLHYLTHEGSIYSSGQVFGIGKSQSVVFVREVVTVLAGYVDDVVRLPFTSDEWNQVAMGFENVCGVPNVVGAIDGSLFRVKRFADFDGWYCRKGFPAFNMQAVVDHKQRFMSYSIRNGSQNDKSVFNRSNLGQTCHVSIPRGCYLLGDAGYQLLPHLLTPYPINEKMSKSESKYNYFHSRTRILVEQAFGKYKGKFRIFKTDLMQSSPEYMAEIIKATMVLHNWMINSDNISQYIHFEPWMYIGGDTTTSSIDTATGRAVRDQLKEFIDNL
jgi:hypothetical protein